MVTPAGAKYGGKISVPLATPVIRAPKRGEKFFFLYLFNDSVMSVNGSPIAFDPPTVQRGFKGAKIFLPLAEDLVDSHYNSLPNSPQALELEPGMQQDLSVLTKKTKKQAVEKIEQLQAQLAQMMKDLAH
jgi:hypothetical protein